MINLKKKHLLKIDRLRIPEKRDLKFGLRLDRNEKLIFTKSKTFQ